MSLEIRPISLREANAFISILHRHNQAVRNGYKFAIGCYECDGGADSTWRSNYGKAACKAA